MTKNNADKIISPVKVSLAIIYGLTFLIIIIVSNFYSQKQVNKNITDLNKNYDLENQLNDLLSNLQDAETGQRGFLLTLDDTYLKPYERALTNNNIILDRVTNNLEEVYQNKFQLLKRLSQDKLNELGQTISLTKNNRYPDAIKLVKTDYGKLKMDSIRMVISELRSVKKAALVKNSASINSLRSISQSLIILSAVVIIGILIFLFIYVRPLFKRISKNTKEIERKNKELEHFAYITSHDLKEPSRTIAGFITAFEEDFEDHLNDDSKYYLEHIKSASQRMNDMISTILSFSNLGKSEKFEKISLNKILAELQEDLKLLLIESSANIAYANLPELYAKRNLIKLLFQNLILNAIKFRKKNVLPKIEINAIDTNNHFVFSVKDNGIGIAPDHQDKIFNFFTKLHLTSEYEGYGIGLSFCKKIAEIHQGQIGVFSKLEQGSTFTIKIHKNLQHENL